MNHPVAASGSHPRSARPAARVVLMLALAAVLGVALPSLLAPAGTAHAASYRFWGYYQLTGSSWAFAQKGPADTTPKDGAVEGWRFAVSDETTPASPGPPRRSPQICGSTAAKAGVQARGRGHRLRPPRGRRGRCHSPGAAGRLRRRRHRTPPAPRSSRPSPRCAWTRA